MKKNSIIFVAGGHNGMVGRAIVRQLIYQKYLQANILTPSRAELNLLDPTAVIDFFDKYHPEYVFLAAAKVGGIMANKTMKADFIYDNLQIQNNVIHTSWKYGVKKLLFLGSSCIYPRDAKQPIQESELLNGKLEETNDAYAVAKIAGIKMCQSYNEQYKTNFISLMPTNLYGPFDNFDPQTAHVLPALINKFHQAKIENAQNVILWGSGSPKREFLYVDDLAQAAIHAMLNYNSSEIINIGYGEDISIRDLALIIKKITKFKGVIEWDKSKPDGTPRKLLNSSKIMTLGWKPNINLEQGIATTYKWYLENIV